MKKNRFRINNFKIIRTCKDTKSDYNAYKLNLIKDFNNRCGYCDTSFELNSVEEIDHFVPQSECKKYNKTHLITSYDNLVLCCKKCNRRKSDKCSDNSNNVILTNELFYDPAVVDYNTIFYRNKFGVIISDDAKGKNMISILRLQNPIHSFSWLIDMVSIFIDNIEKNDCDNVEFIRLVSSLKTERDKLKRMFCSIYNFLK